MSASTVLKLELTYIGDSHITGGPKSPVDSDPILCAVNWDDDNDYLAQLIPQQLLLFHQHLSYIPYIDNGANHLCMVNLHTSTTTDAVEDLTSHTIQFKQDAIADAIKCPPLICMATFNSEMMVGKQDPCCSSRVNFKRNLCIVERGSNAVHAKSSFMLIQLWAIGHTAVLSDLKDKDPLLEFVMPSTFKLSKSSLLPDLLTIDFLPQIVFLLHSEVSANLVATLENKNHALSDTITELCKFNEIFLSVMREQVH
ncbi:hypothetical protein IW261DRAFT_1419211 [Armillaria novae-zelandiae]|uniref:Uncharacterized protein n=1 Tax=Armillaria novae-zelandiae TaxID=153914 RepID=A0AA39PCI9_9AGAR|nr:hypothetical protein IW261DRAFT_1419211 [Armillaria novae-zelandiae]